MVSRLHDLVLDQSARALDTIQSETGKCRRDALAEVVSVAGTARYYLSHGERFLAARRKRGAIPLITRSVRAVKTPTVEWPKNSPPMTAPERDVTGTAR